MRSLKIENLTFQLPSSWNELTYNQLRVVFLAFGINPKPEYVKLQLLKECTGLAKLPWKRRVRELMYIYPFLHKYKIYWLAAVDVALATSAFNFLFDEEDQFAPGLTNMPFAVLTLNKKKYYGPAAAFSNLTVGEWMATETLMARFAETNDTEMLLRVLATLWRGSDKENYRQTLAENSEEAFPNFAKLEAWKAHAIIHWYDSCSEMTSNLFPSIFPKAKDNKKPKRVVASEVFNSLMDILELLANNKVIEKPIVRIQFLFDALYTWASLIEHNKKLEEISK